MAQPPRRRFTGLWAHVATPPQSGRRRSAPPAVRRGLAMAGDDDVDDGGGGDLGVEGLDGNGDGGGGARSDTGTSGAGKTLVKKRITLETDLQKWVTAGSDFIAPKEADGKQVRHVRARGRPRPHPRRARPLLGQAHGRLRAGQDAPDAQVRQVPKVVPDHTREN